MQQILYWCNDIISRLRERSSYHLSCFISHLLAKLPDTNPTSIFPQLDTNSTYFQRIYAVSQTFPLKKPQKVRDAY